MNDRMTLPAAAARAVALALFLASCNGDVLPAGHDQDEQATEYLGVVSVALVEDLATCNQFRRGIVYYIDSTDELVYCDGETHLPFELDGAEGTTWIITTESASAGQCEHGGVSILAGSDLDGDEVLDSGEVAEVEPICNGEPGEDCSVTDVEDGIKVIVCGDSDPVIVQDGEDGEGCEVTDAGDGIKVVVCGDSPPVVVRDGEDGEEGESGAEGPKGDPGASTLVAIVDEPAGANCGAGGVRIDSGVDVDGDGVLDPEEVEQSDYVCDGVGGSGEPCQVEDNGDGTATVSCPGGGQVTLDTQAGGAPPVTRATAEPRGPNCPSGGYLIEVGADADGDGLLGDAEVHSSDYVCFERRWGESFSIQRPGGIASIGSDAEGNVIAVWRESDSILTVAGTIYAAHYDAESRGWAEAIAIEDRTTEVSGGKVAVGSSGSAVAVWEENDSVWANRYDPNLGWTGPTVLESASEFARFPSVAVDPAGNAMVSWIQGSAQPRDVWVNRYDEQLGAWVGPEVIATASGNARSATLDFDAAGNATAVWQQHDGTTYSLFSNRFDAGSGTWGTPTALESSAVEVSLHEFAIDGAGNVFAVWIEDSGTRRLWSSRYDADLGSWSPPTALIDETEDVSGALVVADQAGNATVIWRRVGGIGTRRYDVVSGDWGTPTSLGTRSRLLNLDLALTGNASGDATAVWGNGPDIWSSHFDAATASWASPEVADSDPTNDARYAAMTMDPSGATTLLWLRSATDDLMAARHE